MTRGRGVIGADDPGAADVEAFLAALPADQRADAELPRAFLIHTKERVVRIFLRWCDRINPESVT